MAALLPFWKHEVVLPCWRSPEDVGGHADAGRSQRVEDAEVARGSPRSGQPRPPASSVDTGAECEKQAEAEAELGIAF